MRVKGGYKIVSCIACGAKRQMSLRHGRADEEMIKLFEATGWIYKSGSKGFCENCNLLGQALELVAS